MQYTFKAFWCRLVSLIVPLRIGRATTGKPDLKPPFVAGAHSSGGVRPQIKSPSWRLAHLRQRRFQLGFKPSVKKWWNILHHGRSVYLEAETYRIPHTAQICRSQESKAWTVNSPRSSSISQEQVPISKYVSIYRHLSSMWLLQNKSSLILFSTTPSNLMGVFENVCHETTRERLEGTWTCPIMNA